VITALLNGVKLRAADRFWRLPRAVAAAASDTRMQEAREALLVSGCCVVPDFLDAPTVDLLATKAAALYSTHAQYVSLESKGSDRRIYGADRVCSELELQGPMDWVDALSRAFYLAAQVPWFQMLGRITYSGDNLGSGSGWHRDSPFSHQFKAILYLSDVSEENGPFEYLPGSHRFERLRLTSRLLNVPLHKYRFSDEQVEELERLSGTPRMSVIGRRGSLVLIDSRGLHRGRPLRSGERMAVTRYYFPRRIPDGFATAYPLTGDRQREGV